MPGWNKSNSGTKDILTRTIRSMRSRCIILISLFMRSSTRDTDRLIAIEIKNSCKRRLGDFLGSTDKECLFIFRFTIPVYRPKLIYIKAIFPLSKSTGCGTTLCKIAHGIILKEKKKKHVRLFEPGRNNDSIIVLPMLLGVCR